MDLAAILGLDFPCTAIDTLRHSSIINENVSRMNRFLPILLFALIAVPFLSADLSAQNLAIGIRGGLNVASATNHSLDADPDSQRSLHGLVLGAVAEYSIDPRFGLQIGGEYVERGAMVVTSWGGQSPETTLRYKLTYIDLPLLLKAQFGQSDLRFFGLVGPHVALRLSATGESESEGNRDLIDLTESTKPFDIAVEIGGGVEYSVMPAVSLFADVRFALGVIDVNNYRAPFTIGAWNSTDLKLSTGVMFHP